MGSQRYPCFGCAPAFLASIVAVAMFIFCGVAAGTGIRVGVEIIGLVNASSVVQGYALTTPVAATIFGISCGVGVSAILLLITSVLGSTFRCMPNFNGHCSWWWGLITIMFCWLNAGVYGLLLGDTTDDNIIIILGRTSMATSILGAFFGMIYITFSAGRHINQSFDHKEEEDYGKL